MIKKGAQKEKLPPPVGETTLKRGDGRWGRRGAKKYNRGGPKKKGPKWTSEAPQKKKDRGGGIQGGPPDQTGLNVQNPRKKNSSGGQK